MAMDGLYISGYFSDDDKLMLDNYAERIGELDRLFIRSYEDNVSGEIDDVN